METNHPGTPHRWFRIGKIVRLGGRKSQGHTATYACMIEGCDEKRTSWIGY